MGPYSRHFAAMDLPSSCSFSIHWCPVQLAGGEYFLEFPGVVILCVYHVGDCICSMKIIPAPVKQTNKQTAVEYVCCWTRTAQTLTSWGWHRGWHRFLFRVIKLKFDLFVGTQLYDSKWNLLMSLIIFIFHLPFLLKVMVRIWLQKMWR